MSKRFLLLPVVLIAVVFPLAGCGGGSSSDEDQITDVISTTSTTTSKENCTKLETPAFVEQNFGKTGAAAIKDCSTLQPGESDADSVDVSNVQVNGDKATADVAVHGSVSDGQEVSVSLIKEGDQWKMDRIDSFVKFDQQALADSLVSSLKAQGGFNQQQLTCVAKTATSLPPDALQQAILSGHPEQLGALFKNC